MRVAARSGQQDSSAAGIPLPTLPQAPWLAASPPSLPQLQLPAPLQAALAGSSLGGLPLLAALAASALGGLRHRSRDPLDTGQPGRAAAAGHADERL